MHCYKLEKFVADLNDEDVHICQIFSNRVTSFFVNVNSNY